MNNYFCEIIFKVISGSIYWLPLFIRNTDLEDAIVQQKLILKGLEEQGYEILDKRLPQNSHQNTEVLNEYIQGRMKGVVHKMRVDIWDFENLNIQLDLGFNEHLSLLTHESNEGIRIKSSNIAQFEVSQMRKGEYYDRQIGDLLTLQIVKTRKKDDGISLGINGIYPVHQWGSVPQDAGIAYVFKDCIINLEKGSVELGQLCEISEQKNLRAFAEQLNTESESNYAICYSLTSSLEKTEDQEIVSQIVDALNIKFRPQNSISDQKIYLKKYKQASVCVNFIYRATSSWKLSNDNKIGVLQELVDTFAWIPQKAHL